MNRNFPTEEDIKKGPKYWDDQADKAYQEFERTNDLFERNVHLQRMNFCDIAAAKARLVE